MKGKIIKWSGNLGSGFVLSDDGNEYFVHESELLNSSRLKKGNIIRFDVRDDNKARMRAINIYKVGHGTHHPFIQDLERIYKAVEQLDDEQERNYRLRDIKMIMNYFENVEDVEWCPDVRKAFKPQV